MSKFILGIIPSALISIYYLIFFLNSINYLPVSLLFPIIHCVLLKSDKYKKIEYLFPALFSFILLLLTVIDLINFYISGSKESYFLGPIFVTVLSIFIFVYSIYPAFIFSLLLNPTVKKYGAMILICVIFTSVNIVTGIIVKFDGMIILNIIYAWFAVAWIFLINAIYGKISKNHT